MPERYIVVGCPTTGGGKVMTGNRNFLIKGKPIACIGDEATCPLHNTIASISTGDPTYHIGGSPIARVGDSLSCGCKLLQTEEA
ncbi:PAAR domain-containing protein [Acinetobacter sp. A47]|uniref:PAAR domain-containing protein n=1 Tax=Acinetobacter sp. A47 TaxID=1561217 RepID=UPI0009D6822F|nr:PAAR domain-containing protein [Acinetobacter sp. A47]